MQNRNLIGGQMNIIENVEEWQRSFVQNEFNNGMRSADLGSQPAPWLYRGLKLLEEGKTLTAEKIREINLSGGTDHLDPWFV